MSLVLDTGTMKYRENPNQPWRPLVIKAGMNWESMADTYDPDNGTYEVGQYVLEEGMMYRCVSEITTPEAWTPAHWTSVNVGDELSSFIIISDDQPTDETNKIWIAETTAPFGVQVPTMDDHNALANTLQSTEAYVLGAKTADVSISGSGVYVIYNDALYTTTQSIASTDTAPYTGKITPVQGGGLNSLKSNSVKSTSSRGFACNFTTENYDITLSSAAAADFNLPSSAEIIGVILQNIQNNGCTPIVYCYNNTIYARSNVVINTTLTICLLYK